MSLPNNPNPSSVDIIFSGFGTKRRSVNKNRVQSRRANKPYLGFELGYSLLTFSERDTLLGFLLEKDGNIQPFEALIPTYSDNTSLNSVTATPTNNFSKGSSVITFNGLSGEFSPMNLLRISGKKGVYVVTSAGAVSSGTQTITIRPRLQQDVTTATIFETKNVPVTVTLDGDDLSASSNEMQGNMSFTLIEDAY